MFMASEVLVYGRKRMAAYTLHAGRVQLIQQLKEVVVLVSVVAGYHQQHTTTTATAPFSSS
jgi:hypothetical protein